MTHDQAKIAGAWAAGEVLQYRSKFDHTLRWYDLTQDELEFGGTSEWRIKPKAREWWICPRCYYRGLKDVANHSTFSGGCEGTLVHVREVLE